MQEKESPAAECGQLRPYPRLQSCWAKLAQGVSRRRGREEIAGLNSSGMLRTYSVNGDIDLTGRRPESWLEWQNVRHLSSAGRCHVGFRRPHSVPV